MPAGEMLASEALCAGIRVPNTFDGRGKHYDTHASAGPVPPRDMLGLGSSPHASSQHLMGRETNAGYKL